LLPSIIATFEALKMNKIKSISILGCGWLGFPVGKRLVDAGFTVTGSTTNRAKFELLRKNNINPVLINLQDHQPGELEVFLKSEVLIIAVPTSSVDLENLKNLVEQAVDSALKQIILISSTGVYKETNSEISESDAEALNHGSKLFAVEELVKSFVQFKPVILRMAGLMGYDRNPVNFGKSAKVRANPNGRTNMIHRDDAVEIIVRVIKTEIQNETFNCSADEHPTKKEFYTKLAKMNRIEIPIFDVIENDSFKIISNEKVKKALDFKFRELYASLEG